jgi:hypothetical protein
MSYFAVLGQAPKYSCGSPHETLTNPYNARPAWLDNIHRELDEAVAAAYGWPADLADDEILRRLLDSISPAPARTPHPDPLPAGEGGRADGAAGEGVAANSLSRPSPGGRGRPRRLRGG